MRFLKKLLARIERNLFTRRAYKFVIRDWLALGDLQAAADTIGTIRHSRNLKPLQMDRPKGRRILILSAHPDDEVLGAMGTLRRSIDAGAVARTVYFTTGLEGMGEGNVREIEEVSKQAGYDTSFFHHPVNRIPLDDGVLASLRHEFEIFRPDTVFLPFVLDDHDDHRRVSQVLMELANKSPLHRNIEVWAYQVYTSLIPNVVVDITDRAAEKSRLISLMKSRMAKRNWVHYTLGLNAYNCRFLDKAVEEKYVEAFFVLPLAEYCGLVEHYFAAGGKGAYYLPYYVEPS